MKLQEILGKYYFVSLVSEPYMKLLGRNNELKLLKESMYKKRMKNTILVGDAGCGKSAIIEQFAYDNRFDFKVLELDLTGCVANTRYRGEFEGKLYELFQDVTRYNKDNPDTPIVLYIDEIHTVMKCGGSENGTTAANVLKPYLSKRDITIIGATTRLEYQETILKDSALNRRLSPIFVSNLGKEAVLRILKKFSASKVEDQLLDYIYGASLNLNGTNPDISIEILDRCLAKRKCHKAKLSYDVVDEVVSYMKASELELVCS